MPQAIYTIGGRTVVVTCPKGFKIEASSSSDGWEIDIIEKPARKPRRVEAPPETGGGAPGGDE